MRKPGRIASVPDHDSNAAKIDAHLAAGGVLKTCPVSAHFRELLELDRPTWWAEAAKRSNANRIALVRNTHRVVDISIGQHWSKHWTDLNLDSKFGYRSRYPHRYPASHPQALSNPQDSWCYPLAALGYYREWLQDVYIEGGKFSAYLKGKVSRGDLAPSIAELAIGALQSPQIGPPR